MDMTSNGNRTDWEMRACIALLLIYKYIEDWTGSSHTTLASLTKAVMREYDLTEQQVYQAEIRVLEKIGYRMDLFLKMPPSQPVP